MAALPSVSDDECVRPGDLHCTKRLPFWEGAPFWTLMQVMQAGIRPDVTSDAQGFLIDGFSKVIGAHRCGPLAELISHRSRASFQTVPNSGGFKLPCKWLPNKAINYSTFQHAFRHSFLHQYNLFRINTRKYELYAWALSVHASRDCLTQEICVPLGLVRSMKLTDDNSTQS